MGCGLMLLWLAALIAWPVPTLVVTGVTLVIIGLKEGT